MGALRANVTLTNDNGRNVKSLSEIFIWRTDYVGDGLPDTTYEYYATRVPMTEIDIEIIEELSFNGKLAEHTFVNTPHVKFFHKYSDGAEICIARAILALAEAGMNV